MDKLDYIQKFHPIRCIPLPIHNQCRTQDRPLFYSANLTVNSDVTIAVNLEHNIVEPIDRAVSILVDNLGDIWYLLRCNHGNKLDVWTPIDGGSEDFPILVVPVVFVCSNPDGSVCGVCVHIGILS